VAYSPWPTIANDPEIFWVEPRKRAILPLDGFHLSRSLARTLRRDRFVVTCNAAFTEVMNACRRPAQRRQRRKLDQPPHRRELSEAARDGHSAFARMLACQGKR
jgi:Leu/Phe-tRNA-protein transferase